MPPIPSIPTIPHHLLEQIKAGNVVLFLGAGASYNSKNKLLGSIPNGQDLSDLIAKNFLGEDYIGKALSYNSELAISESSILKVQQFVADIFKEFEPEQYHLKIPLFVWKAIFTTNYDLIVEKSYLKVKSKLQELIPVFKNTSRNQIFIHDKVLPYYKIHGCVNDINDPEAPLILTPDQFVNYQSKRQRLFNELQELSYDYPILFVGFGMSDYDIRSILNGLDKNMAVRVRSYMIGPHITDLEQKMWDNKKISCLKMSFADFLDQVDAKIDNNTRALASLKPVVKLPIFSKFSVTIDNLKPSENFITFLENDIDYVHSNMSAPNTDPKEFYKGYFENWDPIIKNLDINRIIKDGILFEVFMDDSLHNSEGQYLYLIKGNAGSGKSVLLKRLAFDAGTTLERFCIFLRPGFRIKSDQLIELFTYVKDRIYLFVDSLSTVENELAYLINRCKKEGVKISIIGAERINVWNTECELLPKYLTESYHIKYLHNSEINELLLLLEKHHSLGTLASKPAYERVEAFSEKAGRELLVALYEATTSKPFEEIIFDEYKSINNARAQSLYLTVSIFHKLGAEARAGLISRVHNISFHEFKQKLFMPLEFIVFDRKDSRINDFVYVTRNKLIAQIVFEKVLTTPQDRFDEYLRILNNINIDYESDRMAFMSITNARKLLEIFPDPSMVRKIYEVASEQSIDDAKLFQQQAIYEMNAAGGSLYTADRHLKEAHRLMPDDPIISHSIAEMMYKRAEKSTNNSEFFSSIDECLNICSIIIAKYSTNSHPYHTSLKALILKLKHILEYEDAPAIERIMKDIEKAFVSTRQRFPNEEFILEIESKFNEIIKNKTNAKDLLEKAFKVNKSSPFIALRLASFYEKEGDLENSINVVKESLDLNSSDRDLNYKYAMLLEQREIPNYDDIKYYLRRSFTTGDSRFQSQLWYARALYLTNQLNDSREIFRTLSTVNADPEIKREPTGVVKLNKKSVVFEGVVKSVELSYGFIRRDGYGDEIYFYRFEDDYDWDAFKRGTPVTFNIAFNYRGSMAVHIKVKS